MRPLFQFHRWLKPLYFLLLCAPYLMAQDATRPTPTPMSSSVAVRAANELVDAANEDIKAAKELQAEDEAKLTEYKAALNNRRWIEASNLLKRAITNTERGVSLGESASGKFERAAFIILNSDAPKYAFASYLLAKASAVGKRTEAYRELKI